MAKVLVSESNLQDIADAIRGKNGLSTQYTPSQMSAAITAIPSGGSSFTPIKDGKTRYTVIVENDTRTVTLGLNKSSGVSLTISWGDNTSEDVSATGSQDVSHTYAANGEYTIVLDSGEDKIAIGHDGGYKIVTNGTDYCVKYMMIGSNINRIYGFHQNDYALRGVYVANIKSDSTTSGIVSTIFDYCNNLTDVILEDGMTNVRGFQYCPAIQNLTLSNSTNKIWEYTFKGSKMSETISLTDASSIEIGQFAFNESTNLRFLTINAPTITFGSNTFKDCKSIKSVSLTGTTATYGNYQFSGCDNLKDINLLAGSSTTLPRDMFNGCSRLASITVPSGITTIDQYAFANCTALASATLPNTLTTIGQYAFDKCSNLAVLTIPSTVTSIGTYAFRGCTSLTSLIIPEGVTAINTYTFTGCTGLTNITLPSTLTSVAAQAFQNCSGLQEVHVKATTPPTLNNNFGTFGSATIYVPAGTLATYQGANKWSTYSSQMVEESAS